MKKIKKLTVILLVPLLLAFFSGFVIAEDKPVKEKESASIQQSESLPISYDLRNADGKNYVSSVKLQNPFGTCWAHAAISCCETNAMLKGYPSNANFSEKSLAWFNYQFQGPIDASDDELEGVYNDSFKYLFNPLGYEEETNVYNSGGNYSGTAASQLSTWLGASTEEQIPYTNANGDLVEIDGQVEASDLGNWTLDYYDIYNNAFHLQNSEIIDGPKKGASVEDYVPKVKELMLREGSVYIGYSALKNSAVPYANDYFNDQTFAQYIPASANEEPNHGVTVVGWDDNFSKDQFVTTPPGDGAWIIKNSWGSQWGDDGYFYLSYYDSTIYDLASFGIETAEMGYSYDHNYQYDYTGDKFNFTNMRDQQLINSILSSGTQVNPDQYAFANVFTAQGNELLKAVSAYPALPNSQVTAKIYLLNDDYTSPVDGQLVGEVTENFKNRGFYTINIADPIALQAGQKYSIVENIVYTITDSNNQVYNVPMYSLEYGIEDLYMGSLIDEMGQATGTTAINITAKVDEGESYIYGLEGASNSWSDVANPETYAQLSFPENLGDGSPEYDNTIVPGNCMIKAYTSENAPGATLPTGVQFENSGSIYLTAGGIGENTAQVSASVLPSNATNSNVTYSIYPDTIASVTQNGNTAQVTAISEGRAKLIAKTVNGYVATRDIVVSDKEFIVGNVTANVNDQDNLQLEIENLFSNPALSLQVEPNYVQVFVWSQSNMGDLQAMTARQVENTNNWITSDIGINRTASYLINADKIRYVVYVGNENNSTNMIFSGTTSWVQPGTAEQDTVSYISYNQNTGFVEPTVHKGASGNIDNPDSVHMEGLRVSSGVPGSNVTTTVYATGLGWLDPVSDGTYAGTMHENRALEAINLQLETTLGNYKLTYRVYIKDSGWTDWVSSGQVAGNPGQGQPIQAVEIDISAVTPEGQ